MRTPISPARLAYLKMRREKAALRLVNCEVNDFKPRQWVPILKQFDYTCVYCMKRTGRLTKDHVIPLHRGGNHTEANLVPACRSCNSSKGKSTLEEWFGYQDTH